MAGFTNGCSEQDGSHMNSILILKLIAGLVRPSGEPNPQSAAVQARRR
jgi:hypothetical protein